MSDAIENPGKLDITIKDIFTDEMYNELEALMRQLGIDDGKLEKTKSFWEKDYKNKKIIR